MHREISIMYDIMLHTFHYIQPSYTTKNIQMKQMHGEYSIVYGTTLHTLHYIQPPYTIKNMNETSASGNAV